MSAATRVPRPVFALLLFGAGVLACQDVDTDRNTVDCIGMDDFYVSDLRIQRSALTAFDEVSGSPVVRCEWQSMGDDAIYRFAFDGEIYRAVEMQRVVEQSGEGWVRGHYKARVGVWDSNQAPPAESLRELEGEFSYCDLAARDGDCPFTPVDGLEARYHIVSPARPNAGEAGGASECTLIFDRAHRNVMLDLVPATHRGFNVGRIATWCSAGQVGAVQPGHLHFEMAGIDDYGPTGMRAVTEHPGRALPSLVYRRDVLAVDTPTGEDVCHYIGAQATVTSQAHSQCSLDFDADGQVAIVCESVRDFAPFPGQALWDREGPFSFEANCTLVER